MADNEVVVAQTSNGQERMQVKIAAPYKVYFNGKAESVSAVNDTGPFDVLPEHHNFITLLSPCDVVVQMGGKKETIPINRGIMHVKKDRVLIFLDV
jgi:F0F1-type ATP synthase epsilon subunit